MSELFSILKFFFIILYITILSKQSTNFLISCIDSAYTTYYLGVSFPQTKYTHVILIQILPSQKQQQPKSKKNPTLTLTSYVTPAKFF